MGEGCLNDTRLDHLALTVGLDLDNVYSKLSVLTIQVEF
jgi:hypothetical protein